MGAGMDERRQVPRAETGQSQARISDPVHSDAIQDIRLVLKAGAGEEVLTALKETLDTAHNQWAALSSKYNITVNADGTVQFSTPKDLPVADAWSGFRKEMTMGAGSEALGFSETKAPEWFPKNAGETATIGTNVGIVGANMTREQQAAFLERQGLRFGSAKEGVEALVAQQIGIAHANERIYQGLSDIAGELGKPMISNEVVAEWDRRELSRISESIRRLSPMGLSGYNDGLNVDRQYGEERFPFVGLAARSKPE